MGPDILVIVADTVRADSMARALASGAMPQLARWSSEFVRFDRTVSPAPWTLPSHASLLTGLYPWQHDAHTLARRPRVSDAYPQLPSLLGDAGYRTLSLSANPYVSEEFGLTRGFDDAGWGEWVDHMARGTGDTAPPRSLGGRLGSATFAARMGGGPLHALAQKLFPLAVRAPPIWDLGSRVWQGLRSPGAPYDARACRWIEPTLDRWLRARRKDEPVFCFVNLIEAHEPYFPLWSGDLRWGEYLRYLSTSQDQLRFLSGAEAFDDGDWVELRRHYEATLRVLDERIARLLDLFRAHGRWEGSMVAITSDHGQAFGENGCMYHGLDVDDAEVRVPLLAKLPHAREAHLRPSEWHSLVDLFPTVLHATGTGDCRRQVGACLYGCPPEGPPRVVMSFADGLHGDPRLSGVASPKVRELLHPRFAAYEGSWKVCSDDAGRLLDRSRVRWEGYAAEGPSGAPRGGEAPHLDAAVRRATGEFQARARLWQGAQGSRRLQSWGYL